MCCCLSVNTTHNVQQSVLDLMLIEEMKLGL